PAKSDALKGVIGSHSDVRFGSKADMCGAARHVRFTSNSDRESGHTDVETASANGDVEQITHLDSLLARLRPRVQNGGTTKKEANISVAVGPVIGDLVRNQQSCVFVWRP